jgi:hypothetical protein
MERQITAAPCGHILTNTGVWSPDGQWIVFDIRSDPAGDRFDASQIQRVHVRTGEVQTLYQSRNGAHCGVATHSPVDDRVAFILGPENPTSDWSYAAYHRRGVIVDANQPEVAISLDACDITPPFTPGALRGGSHVHVFDGAGQWISFTYEDAILANFDRETPEQEMNLRGIGVSVPGHPVRVSRGFPRNFDGNYFSVLVTRLHGNPISGSDQIKRASEEAWVGTNGYLRADGERQKHAIAFQGQVVTHSGETISELFIVELPEDLTKPGAGPLAGTTTRRPLPPAGCSQRRLTFSQNRKYPGIQGPRHWTRCSPDGSQIAFLMRDDAGIVQLHAASPNGGSVRQITHNPWSIASAFTWSPDGRHIAAVIDNSIFITNAHTGESHRLTKRSSNQYAPRPEACVFSPDGQSIAYVRQVDSESGTHNQIFVLSVCPTPKPQGVACHALHSCIRLGYDHSRA